MKTKKCTGECGLEKPLSEFHKCTGGKLGVRANCKDCINKKAKEYRDNNKVKIANYQKEYRDKNKDYFQKYNKENKKKIKKQLKKWYFDNKQAILKKAKKYYIDNSENIGQRNKKWKDKNKEKISKQSRIYYIENKEIILKYEKEKRKINIIFKLLCNLRRRLNHALKDNTKSKRTLELLGCTIDELKIHLESKFTKGMNWDNYGLHGWHIDHKLPCASFDLSKKSEQLKCFNYINLQPLWAKDNLSKGSKIL